MKIYKCDGKKCSEQDSNVKHWLTIGGPNGQGLRIENNISNYKNIISVGNHSDLHFCSRHCFYNFFFMSEKEIEAQNKEV